MTDRDESPLRTHLSRTQSPGPSLHVGLSLHLDHAFAAGTRLRDVLPGRRARMQVRPRTINGQHPTTPLMACIDNISSAAALQRRALICKATISAAAACTADCKVRSA